MKALRSIGLAALCGALSAATCIALAIGVDLFVHGPNPKVGLRGEAMEFSMLVVLASVLGAVVGAAFGALLLSVRHQDHLE